MSAVAPQEENISKARVLTDIESGRFESLTTEEILTFAVKNYHPRLALSCSFGAPEGMVILDMLHNIEPTSRVFVLDTGRLHQASYDLMDRIRERYGKRIEVIFPESGAVQEMVNAKGMNLFYESVANRKLCCRVRKVEPLNRYLADLDAWVSGLRRDQNVTRTDTGKVEIDHVHGDIVKFNPIADWTHEQVLQYVAANDIPTNRLHKRGYASVGCDPCSRAVEPGEDPRAGRWWWENPETKECGIHVEDESGGSGI